MLTRKQLSAISINVIIVKMLMTYPRFLYIKNGNAAWIVVLYCTFVAFLLFYVTKFFYRYNVNIIDLSEKIGGKTLRIIIGTVVILIMGLKFFSLIRIVPDFIRLVLLKETYTEVIGLVFIISLIVGAFCGIESIGRVHRFFMPVAGIIFFIFLLLLIPSLRIDNILPVMGKGSFNLFIDGISALSIFSDILLINILIPNVRKIEDYEKSGTNAIIIGGAVSVLISLVYSLSYPYPVSTEFIIPIYQLERLIHFSTFFSRFEAVFQFVWCISVILYGATYVTVISEVFKSTFNHRYSKPLITPIAICIVGAALMPQTFSDMANIEMKINEWIYLPSFFIPIALGIAYKIKKCRKGK